MELDKCPIISVIFILDTVNAGYKQILGHIIKCFITGMPYTLFDCSYTMDIAIRTPDIRSIS